MTRIQLSPMEFDALKEIGNISTGNAITSLSILINKNVDMTVPESKFVPISEFSNEVGGPETVVSGIYLELKGGVSGEALFLFPETGALELVDIIMGREFGKKKEMDEMDISAFKEMSNILAGSFLTALSKMLNVKILPSIPHVATDMVQSLIDGVLAKISFYAEEVFFVKTKINVAGHNINGDFVVIFDKPSLELMVSVIHTNYG